MEVTNQEAIIAIIYYFYKNHPQNNYFYGLDANLNELKYYDDY